MGADYRQKYARTVLGGAELLVNPQSRAANQWFGRVTVTAPTVTISTAIVQSGSLIFISPQLLSPVAQGAQPAVWMVASINPGASFTLGLQNSAAVLPSSGTIAWILFNPA
jgi:hypothetical protein